LEHRPPLRDIELLDHLIVAVIQTLDLCDQHSKGRDQHEEPGRRAAFGHDAEQGADETRRCVGDGQRAPVHLLAVLKFADRPEWPRRRSVIPLSRLVDCGY
jgi:hypothetical protein